jgi:hypothetical protein
VGLEEISQKTIDIYPNPVSSGEPIKIEIPGSGTFIESIRIFSIDGREVFNEAPVLKSRSFTLTADFSPGVYFILTKHHGRINSQKIIIL